jgi:hypothetical protein
VFLLPRDFFNAKEKNFQVLALLNKKKTTAGFSWLPGYLSAMKGSLDRTGHPNLSVLVDF